MPPWWAAVRWAGILAAAVLAPGCGPGVPPIPEEFSETLARGSDPVHITWYLSKELRRDENARRTDQFLAALADAEPRLRITFRDPRPGDERPAGLLSLPALDADGRWRLLVDGAAVDTGDIRVIIPDLRESRYHASDILRGIQDAVAGGPIKVGLLDGAVPGEPGGRLPGDLLAGRWDPVPLLPGVGWPGDLGILVLRDGSALAASIGMRLDAFVSSGGRVLVVPAPAGVPDGPLGVWEQANRQSDKVIRLSPTTPLVEAIGLTDGGGTFREWDALLLGLAGRRDILEAVGSGETPTTPGRRPAGRRLKRRAGEERPPAAEFDPEDVAVIRVGGGEDDGFVLTREEDRWTLISGSWRLPARQERVDSFLTRSSRGLGHVLLMAAGIGNARENAGLALVLENRRGKPTLRVTVGGTRSAGGGVWTRFSGSEGLWLWPGLLDAFSLGDSLYWMDRRVFGSLDPRGVIRVEAFVGGVSSWKLVLEDRRWLRQEADGRVSALPEELVTPYLARLAQTEALTLVPAEALRPEVQRSLENPSVSLVVENTSGKMIRIGASTASFVADGGIPAVAISTFVGHPALAAGDVVANLFAGPRPK